MRSESSFVEAERTKEMAVFKDIPPEELEKISGGIIVKDGDFYMLLSDDAKLLRSAGCVPVSKAKASARNYGWSDEVLSFKEFEKRYGRLYDGDDYWYSNDQGFWEYDDGSDWV